MYHDSVFVVSRPGVGLAIKKLHVWCSAVALLHNSLGKLFGNCTHFSL